MERLLREALGSLDAGMPLSWSEECHGQICKVTMVSASADTNKWMMAVQSGRTRLLAKSMMFRGGRLRLDAGTGAGLSESDFYAELLSLDDERAQRQTQAMLESFVEEQRRDNVLADCARRHPDHGELEAAVVVASGGKVSTHFGGSVSTLPAGRCAIDRIERAVQLLHVPAATGVTAAVHFKLETP